MTSSFTLSVAVLASTTRALIFPTQQSRLQPRVVAYGIFDGVKDAFSQDVSILEDDRVTPFGTSPTLVASLPTLSRDRADRWLGIDVRSEDSKQEQYAVPDDFVDSMVSNPG